LGGAIPTLVGDKYGIGDPDTTGKNGRVGHGGGLADSICRVDRLESPTRQHGSLWVFFERGRACDLVERG
jgi:hypothetical protein